MRYVWITELDYFDLIDVFDICIEVTASNRQFNWKIHWQYISRNILRYFTQTGLYQCKYNELLKIANKEVHNCSYGTSTWKQRANLAISIAWQISIENKWA